ncbi:MAG: Clp protease ClpP [Cyclobacteriaceae bacterium]
MKRFELCALSPDQAEIYLYGTFGEEILASEVVQKILEASGKYKTILLRLHSRGGDPLDGLGILQAIKDAKTKVEVNTQCDGMAASFASVIFACGTKREIAQFGRVMIHQASGFGYGQVDELKQTAALMETINDDMASIYAEATGKEKDWILKNWMASGQDKWFRAQDAKDEGIATSIIPGLVAESSETNPIKLAAHFDSVLFNSQHNSDTMKLSMYIPGLNKVPGIKLSAESSDAEISEAIETALGKTVELAAELETETELRKAKEQEIQELSTSALKEKSEALIEANVGVKITAEEKDYFLTMAGKDEDSYEATKKQLNAMPKIQSVSQFLAEGNKDLAGKKSKDGQPLIELGYKELFKNHPKFLAQMKTEDVELAREKYEDEFGKKPTW